MDNIGDYVLYRNFLLDIKNSPYYYNKDIDLICNETVYKFVMEFDYSVFRNVICINRKRFTYSFIYKLLVLLDLTKFSYKYSLNPTFSREFLYDDFLILCCSAHHKVCSSGNLSNSSYLTSHVSKLFYDTIFPSSSDIKFEFFRNMDFFRAFDSRLELSEFPSLSPSVNYLPISLPRAFILFFIGASTPERKLPADKHIFLISEILKKFPDINIIITGGRDDIYASEFICKSVNSSLVTNLVGVTSFNNLLQLTNSCICVVSNDTSLPHIAIAGNSLTKVLVIYNGHHLGRFLPYPDSLASFYKLILHPKILNHHSYKTISNDPSFRNNFDMSDLDNLKILQSINKFVELALTHQDL